MEIIKSRRKLKSFSLALNVLPNLGIFENSEPYKNIKYPIKSCRITGFFKILKSRTPFGEGFGPSYLIKKR